MKFSALELRHFLLQLPAGLRRFTLIVIDLCFLLGSIFFTYHVLPTTDSGIFFYKEIEWLYSVSCCFAFFIYVFTGQYDGLTRYFKSKALYFLAFRNLCLISLIIFIGFSFKLSLPSFSSFFVLWIIVTSLTGSIRFILRDLLLKLRTSQKKHELKNVAVYGAGSFGAQIAAAILQSNTKNLSIVVDDDSKLWNRNINGILINSPNTLKRNSNKFDEILIAIPSLTRTEFKNLFHKLQYLGKPILRVPSLDQISSGQVIMDSIRPILIEDLLGRDPLPEESKLLFPAIKDKIICVTGAGGSIGSELCLQIEKLSPSLLIIIDHSESNLYHLNQELSIKNTINVLPILGSVTDSELIKNLFNNYNIDIVFHAAAYKHVPLVELNPLEGIYNNVRSTFIISSVAYQSNIKQVVLISTDKAVRPTNVMGASKRLAELIIQAFAHKVKFDPINKNKITTKFSLVRFGNVLGSSGSVVPLFRKQIKSGGPITVTHKNVIRYFMTISEAAQLVIQSTLLAKGGDLFLLDMGEPIKIFDLAKQMISLSGLSFKNKNNIDGDIEIVFTGLRPGEKLYEELLIDAKAQVTSHPKIFTANEKYFKPHELWPDLKKLEESLAMKDKSATYNLMSKLVKEWAQ